jgi:hypothetical protein
MLALIALSLLSSTCPPGESLEGGAHSRLATRRGPVHLWCRADSEPTKVVVYVHGYRDDADSAFHNHALAAQFAKSKVDALFVVVEAPSGPEQSVMFGDLDELLSLVGAPDGPVLVIGHSGGNRTLKSWLRSSRVEEVVLLDGFYGESASWTKWLATRPNASLRIVGQHTQAKSEAWLAAQSQAVRARVTHQPAKCGHMEIITQGNWLPRVITEWNEPPSPSGRGSGCGGVTKSLSERPLARASLEEQRGPLHPRAPPRCRDTRRALLQ